MVNRVCAVRPLVSPTAVSVWGPGIWAGGTADVVVNEPILPVGTEASAVASKLMSTSSPGEKPVPLRVMGVVGGPEVGPTLRVTAGTASAAEPKLPTSMIRHMGAITRALSDVLISAPLHSSGDLVPDNEA